LSGLLNVLLGWSLWSKDLIFLVPSESWAGPQAWVDAYHDAQPSSSSPSSSSESVLVDALPLKSGALQGVIAVDYPFDARFDAVHIVYDGVNGQLPNLDLVNTAAAVAGGQMGIGTSLQQMWTHDDNSYADRLRTMLRGMVRQALGHAAGPHSSFIPYHVDAITLQAVGAWGARGGGGRHDEMALGRTLEGIFRSLNNLLEHFHQSFFFYLLLGPSRFVSIGTYLPSAMLIAGNFTIMAIALWVQSGRPPPPSRRRGGPSDLAPISQTSSSSVPSDAAVGSAGKTQDKGAVATATAAAVVRKGDAVAVILPSALAVAERELFLPLAIVIGIHFWGLVPLYIFNQAPAEVNPTPTQLPPPGQLSFCPTTLLLLHFSCQIEYGISSVGKTTETFLHSTPFSILFTI
jgi:glycosylphosphatidylinositol transamidase